MKKQLIFLAILSCFALSATELLSPRTRWVPTVFSGKGKVSLKRDKGLFIQKQWTDEANTNYHTLDLPVVPGDYTFSAEVMTDGHSDDGGAELIVQMQGSRRVLCSGNEAIVTNGKWEILKIDFSTTPKDKVLRLWIAVDNFMGTVYFRNPSFKLLRKHDSVPAVKTSAPAVKTSAPAVKTVVTGNSGIPEKIRWIASTASGKGSVSFKRDGNIFIQKHQVANGRTVYRTDDFKLLPGKYQLSAAVMTDGEAAPQGGAGLVLQKMGAKRAVVSKTVATGKKWQKIVLNFEINANEDPVRVHLLHKGFKGESFFRNVVLKKAEGRSPYTIADTEFFNPDSLRLNCEPFRTYQVVLGDDVTGTIKFFSGDDREISSTEITGKGKFTVPDKVVRTMLSTAKASPVCVKEIPGTVEAFDWKFWNSWFVYNAGPGGKSVKEFTLDKLPEYAIGRFFCPMDITINGKFVGRGCRGYTDNYYFDLKPFLKTGKNLIEMILPENLKERRLSAEIEFRYADGSKAVLLSGDGSWTNIAADGTKSAADHFVPSWYNPELFDKDWVTPSGIPDRVLRKINVSAKADFADNTVQAGKKLPGKLEVTFEEMPFFQNNRIALTVRDANGKKVWKQWIFTDEDLTTLKAKSKLVLPFELATYFIPEGKYTIHLAEIFNSAKVAEISVKGSYTEEKKKSRFVRQGSMDILDVGGEKILPAIYRRTGFYGKQFDAHTEDDIHAFSKTGYKLFTLINVFGYDVVKNGGLEGTSIWVGENELDFSMIDHNAELILSANPDARIIYCLNVSVPTWWVKANPAEAAIWDDGTPGPLVSLASEKFRKELQKNLEKTLQYVASRPWGSRVVGCYFACGYDGQWFEPMDYRGSRRQRFSDYSVHMLKKFREYLKKEYGTVDALRKAWGNDTVTFENAAIPTREERDGTTYYLDPVKSRNVVDFLYATSAVRNEMIDLLSSSMKKYFDVPFGTYFIPNNITYRNGQAQRPATDEIYDNPNYNYAAAPLGYDCHGLSQAGTGGKYIVNRTKTVNDVFFIGEDDTRTYLSMPKNPRWGNPDTFGTYAGMRRNSASKLVRGQGFWYFDMYGHWFLAPELQKLFRKELSVMDALTHFPELKALDAEAVNVVKIGTLLHKRSTTDKDLHQVHFPGKDTTATAFPMDLVNTRDLTNPKLPKYKVFFFDDLFALNDEEVKKIDALKKNGALLIFTHATGYSNEKTLSAANISRLTGINVVEAAPGKDLSAMNWVVAVNNPVMRSLVGKEFRQVDAKRFNVVDPQAITLGNFSDDNSVAAAFKDFGTYRVIYLPAGFPKMELLNAIGSYVGLHVYSDDPVNLIAYGRMVRVYCPVDKVSAKIRLPEKFSAFEVFSGKKLKETKLIETDMVYGDTRLYFLGSEEEVDRFAKMISEK